MFDGLTAGAACRRLRWMVLATLLPGCGGSPTRPDPPLPPPTLTCPADIRALARLAQRPVVTFDTPAAAGGVAPVATTCLPPSGTAFDLGTTRVTCTAIDSRGRSGTCGFSVIVSAVPVLTSIRFVAFGDSITEGTTSPDPTALLLSLTESYPYKLQALLSARYIDQKVTVDNDGLAGEPIYPTGMTRFTTVLDVRKPQVALLLDGANDLLAAGRSGTFDVTIPLIVTALDNMVRAAQGRGVRVLLATFPPQNSQGSRGAGAPGVPRLNADIANLAAARGAVLVDLYNGLGGTPTGSIGVDGLHPTDTGYTKIANIWFEAIRREYERSDSTLGSGSRPPRLVIPLDEP